MSAKIIKPNEKTQESGATSLFHMAKGELRRLFESAPLVAERVERLTWDSPGCGMVPGASGNPSEGQTNDAGKSTGSDPDSAGGSSDGMSSDMPEDALLDPSGGETENESPGDAASSFTQSPQFQEALAAECRRIEREAYSKAFLQGEEEGLAQGRKSVEVLTQRLLASIAEIDGLRRQIFEQSERDLVHLALAIARRLTLDVVACDERYLSKLAQESIQAVLDHDSIICRVNPSEFEHLHKHREELAKVAGEGKTLLLREDGSVDAGGLIIDTDLGCVDATLEARLDRIREALVTSELEA